MNLAGVFFVTELRCHPSSWCCGHIPKKGCLPSGSHLERFSKLTLINLYEKGGQSASDLSGQKQKEEEAKGRLFPPEPLSPEK